MGGWIELSFLIAPLAFWWCCCSRCRCCTRGSAPDSYQVTWSGFTSGWTILNGTSVIVNAGFVGGTYCTWSGYFPLYNPDFGGLELYQICGFVPGGTPPAPGGQELVLVVSSGAFGTRERAGQFSPLNNPRNCRGTWVFPVALRYGLGPSTDNGTATVVSI